jgi:hypothetical protein
MAHDRLSPAADRTTLATALRRLSTGRTPISRPQSAEVINFNKGIG